jgi:hypothetical protein
MAIKEIGINLFDDTTYQPHRLMYWTSMSSNGDYVFKKINGMVLNPDDKHKLMIVLEAAETKR